MAGKKTKSRIYEFDPAIYPTRLWCAVNPTVKQMQSKFYFLNEEGEIIDGIDLNEHCNSVATTFSVSDKTSGWKGCFVCIWRPKQTGVGVIAHEGLHCTDWLCDELGLCGFSFEDGEARAYYLQWVANNIANVLRNKV